MAIITRRRHFRLTRLVCRLFLTLAALGVLYFTRQGYQLLLDSDMRELLASSPRVGLLLWKHGRSANSSSDRELAQVQSTSADARHSEFVGCNLSDILRSAYTFRKVLRHAGKRLMCAGTSVRQGEDVALNVCGMPISALEVQHFHVATGGHFRPTHCIPKSKTAIIVPFRNRWSHLSDFLLNMHPFLQRQNIEYTIFVINQDERNDFNRGMLLNIGAVEALKFEPFDCFIFHDVDLLPENHGNYYTCPSRGSFRHMSVAVDKFNYSLPYETLVGGVLAADRWAFEDLNGYSNVFFGWGGEDDDFAARLLSRNYTIHRYDPLVARYRMLSHLADEGNGENDERYRLLAETSKRSRFDGLNSLRYSVTALDAGSLFTLMNVSIDQDHIVTTFFKNLARYSLLPS